MADSVLNSHKEKEQMRYEKGDKVIIKSREWYDKNKDESGIITFNTDRGDYNITKEDEHFLKKCLISWKYDRTGT